MKNFSYPGQPSPAQYRPPAKQSSDTYLADHFPEKELGNSSVLSRSTKVSDAFGAPVRLDPILPP